MPKRDGRGRRVIVSALQHACRVKRWRFFTDARGSAIQLRLLQAWMAQTQEPERSGWCRRAQLRGATFPASAFA